MDTDVFYISNGTVTRKKPVKWKTLVEKISDTEYDLKITAFINSGWYLYTQNSIEKGPSATAFMFDDSQGEFTLTGNTSEQEGKIIEDAVFKVKVKTFEDQTIFKQKIIVTGKQTLVKAIVEYMAGSTSKVLPLSTVDLIFDLTKINSDKTVSVLENSTKKDKDSDKGLLAIFIVSFLSGFAALLTPSVFPMIPMTASFFTKQSENRASGIRNAIIYGISIIVIYVGLGTLVTTIFGADSLNALATNVTFNLIFFFLLVFFALSFLGAFEIVLPSSWLTKIDSKSGAGGIIGILFMAFALAVVSFSCTGPIVGTLLVQAASQGGAAPIIGMFGFSLAIALPFALFAAFPGWLNSLPKSGGWLNSVKVV